MARLNDTIENKMFYGAKPLIFERARMLRLNPTAAEVRLWEVLKNKQILGLKFRRQHPINIFIADFYCHSLKLVIEVDGDIHLSKDILEHDEGRTFELENFGLDIIRFTNNQIYHEIEEVKAQIELKCIELMAHVTPSPLKGVSAHTK